MSWFRYRRTQGWLAVLLAFAWVVSSAQSDSFITQGMHCGRGDMPCCPRAGGHSAHCSPAQCIEQTPQKTDTRPVLGKQVFRHGLASGAKGPAVPAAEMLGAVSAGARFPASVFQLKGELRI